VGYLRANVVVGVQNLSNVKIVNKFGGLTFIPIFEPLYRMKIFKTCPKKSLSIASFQVATVEPLIEVGH
jgi:hypothetical protein